MRPNLRRESADRSLGAEPREGNLETDVPIQLGFPVKVNSATYAPQIFTGRHSRKALLARLEIVSLGNHKTTKLLGFRFIPLIESSSLIASVRMW